MNFNKFIGNKAFYKHTLAIALPIMIQNGITNFVSMLDNIMLGRVGTEQMSGVAIVNQLLMIYYLCIFGGVAGAGIFTAQYYGTKDNEGIRNTVRFKILISAFLTVLAFIIFTVFDTQLITSYLRGGSDGGDLSAALHYGRQYLKIMLVGLLPFMMLQVYTGTLRECNETVVPMKAGIVAVFVNLILNYLLIYGKFGFPKLGVVGAALATVTARYTEAAIVIIWTHKNKDKHKYIVGVYKKLLIPLSLFKKMVMKGLPLLVNETLWSGGMATLAQCYSIRGLSVVAGMNIANTIYNVFNIVFIAMGDAVAIIVGQLLGADKLKEAKETDTKLIAFSVFSCVIISIIMLIIAPLFPRLYNTTPQARSVAVQFIVAQALFMPQNAFIHAAYFTLRSGGKTIVTFLFDSVFMWALSIPVAFIASRYTNLPAVYLFVVVQLLDIIKCIIGFILVKNGVWVKKIVAKSQ